MTQLGNVLGLNGQPGSDAALKTLEATPGYQFQLQQGDNAINAQAAATGMNASGNQALALAKYNQGLAGTTYNNYVGQLQPFLNASNAAAGGISGVNMGQGNAVAGQQDQLAQLGWNKDTGIGNANANADLAAYNASGNFWNAIGSIGGAALGGVGGMKTSGGGTVGGNAISGIGSGISGLASSIFGTVSDRRAKEDVSPVGETFDGQQIYRYKYLGDPKWQIGLMAQDVEKVIPEAVGDAGFGLKAVDYGAATERASKLGRFLINNDAAEDTSSSYTSDLSRFLEAA